MNPEELQNSPKLFCENIRIGYSPEYFVMALASGAQATIYSLTPEHAKRLYEYLGHELAAFEKRHGTIDATWNPNVVSPVQPFHEPGEGS
ncbi:MAG TPA: hypothetical protein VFS75_03350 [Candidatus Paceibacterota bacterium]|nr:hypothetical protein [Candidatus Paceibacterota bacterium]